jgi:hypothetical protein
MKLTVVKRGETFTSGMHGVLIEPVSLMVGASSCCSCSSASATPQTESAKKEERR